MENKTFLTLEEAKNEWPQIPLRKNSRDLTNKQFTLLTCLYPAKRQEDNKSGWVCKCKCGKYLFGVTNSIISNKKKSCGSSECRAEGRKYLVTDMSDRNFIPTEYKTYIDPITNKTRRYLNLTGLKSGRLLVINLDWEYEKIRSNGIRKWICKCDCGNIISVLGTELTRKNKPQRSCGCLAKERQENFWKQTYKDLTGMTFGELYIKKKIDKSNKSNKYNHTLWECECSCGNICEVSSRELLSGDTISCGCLKNSYREYLIEKFLKEHNISYQKEYKFLDLRDKMPLRFDFAIFSNNKLLGLIEHQGIQHVKNVKWHTETLEKHDQMKKEYCLQNNISLFEIMYNDNLEEKLQNILNALGVITDGT